jgi:hypothetical protein
MRILFRLGCGLHGSDFTTKSVRAGSDIQGQRKGKGRAFGFAAVDADLPAVGLDKAAYNRQP